jgi:hypothetical protein
LAFSPDLEGFSGIGHSIENRVYKGKWGMEEHLALLQERGECEKLLFPILRGRISHPTRIDSASVAELTKVFVIRESVYNRETA